MKTVKIDVPKALEERVCAMIEQHLSEVASAEKEKRRYCFHEFTYGPVTVSRFGNPTVIKTCTKCGRSFRQVIGSHKVNEV